MTTEELAEAILEGGFMTCVSRGIRGRSRHRVARVLLVAAVVAIALRGVAMAACENLDPAEVERFTKLATAAVAAEVPPTPAMTTGELASALRKARLPQAAAVAALPGVVEERSFDFLNGGTYLKATLDGPRHSEVFQFVRQRNRLIPLQRGRAGRERIARDVQISVRAAEAAKGYVQWLLDVTGEGGLSLVASADDVPFTRPAKHETELKAAIGVAREGLEGKIQPPRAEAAGPVFVVHQDAVVARDLVRYTVKVSKLGLATIQGETLARDLPVVYLATAD